MYQVADFATLICDPSQQGFLLFVFICSKGQELNKATPLASQPVAKHSFGFIVTFVFVTLGEICKRGWSQKVTAEFGSHA